MLPSKYIPSEELSPAVRAAQPGMGHRRSEDRRTVALLAPVAIAPSESLVNSSKLDDSTHGV